MATSTYMTFLMHEVSSKWEKLCDIKEFPDLGGDPEMLETTTLSDGMQTYINGIQTNSGLTFKANYEKEAYTALKKLENKTEKYAVWFGGTVGSDNTVTPTGSLGKFSCNGQLSCHVDGGSVNEVRNMTMTIAPSTVIVSE